MPVLKNQGKFKMFVVVDAGVEKNKIQGWHERKKGEWTSTASRTRHPSALETPLPMNMDVKRVKKMYKDDLKYAGDIKDNNTHDVPSLYAQTTEPMVEL